MKTRSITAALAAAITFAGTGLAPGHANTGHQAPKPPADAKKVVNPPKNGTFTTSDSDRTAFVQSATMGRDFDVTFSTITPASTEYYVGVQFRAVSFSRFYALLVNGNGEASMLIFRDADQIAAVKEEPTPMPSLKKNTGEKNDFGLYVRGNVATLFVNKVLVDTWDVTEINDFGNMWLFAFGSKDKAVTMDYKNFTVKVPNNAIPPEATGVVNKNMVVSLYRSGYNRWGRPIGMDNPRAGCDSYDDGRPVLQFQAVMKVENKGKTPMKRWAPFAYTRSGKLAFGCYLGYDRAPVIQPGQSADVTAEYFIEPGDAIAYISVLDLDNGRSNKLLTPAP